MRVDTFRRAFPSSTDSELAMSMVSFTESHQLCLPTFPTDPSQFQEERSIKHPANPLLTAEMVRRCLRIRNRYCPGFGHPSHVGYHSHSVFLVDALEIDGLAFQDLALSYEMTVAIGQFMFPPILKLNNQYLA